MSRFLCLETSAVRCSVALFEDDHLVAWKSTDEDRAHSRKLVIFIKELFEQAGLDPASIDAIAYSAGPGSYTGLRVGLSAAKGLAFALDIPLIAVSTSRIFFLEAKENIEADRFITLQDARRMEAYATIFEKDGRVISEDIPTILDENWSAELIRDTRRTVLCGTGAEKTRGFFEGCGHISIFPAQPDARFMIEPTLEAWREQRFENILLSEPKYVKAPNITTPRTKSF